MAGINSDGRPSSQVRTAPYSPVLLIPLISSSTAEMYNSQSEKNGNIWPWLVSGVMAILERMHGLKRFCLKDTPALEPLNKKVN
jgi:hypothetical protein